jgi:hypothetical protein
MLSLGRIDVYHQPLLPKKDKRMAYSAMMASIIVVFGLPMTVGAFFPSKAKTRGADIDPEPVCQFVPSSIGDQLTWPSGAACWEYLVLVGEEEMTIGIIS